MKKILGIVVLSLIFYSNPMVIENSKAGLFSSPLEKCMDRVIKGTFSGNEQSSGAAAKLCQGADKGTIKCMDRVIEGTFNGNEQSSGAAAKLCTGN
jgi:hypothetical protein